MAVQTKVVLEPAAQELADATSTPPFLYELDYPDARKVLEDLQAAPVDKLPIDEEWITVPSALGDARVRIIKPQAPIAPECAHCGAPLGDAPVLLVRERGEHRIGDGFCSVEHMLEWAKAGGRYR